MKQKPILDLWSLFEPMITKKYGRKPGPGRPPVDLKRTFEAIFVDTENRRTLALHTQGPVFIL